MAISTYSSRRAAPVELPETIFPVPAPSVRNWLLGGLIAWQVGMFWILPICAVAKQPWFSDSTSSDYEPFLSTALAAEVFAEVCVGMSLALAGNLALMLSQSSLNVLTRLLGGAAIFFLAQTGMAATFGRGYFAFFPVLAFLLSFLTLWMATSLWICLPGIRQRTLIDLEEGSPEKAQGRHQLRIIHLFYLMSAVAIACCALRNMSSIVRLEDLFHEPIDKALLGMLFAGVTCFFALAAHLLALSGGSRVWYLALGAFVVPGIAFIVSYLIEGLTGREWSYELFRTTFVVLGVAFALLCGTGLALRLLGYRLVRMPC